jgi:hypothetical protein
MSAMKISMLTSWVLMPCELTVATLAMKIQAVCFSEIFIPSDVSIQKANIDKITYICKGRT